MAVGFDKYDRYGAIHWQSASFLSLRYNPALVSRYNSVVKHLPGSSKSVLDIGCGDGKLVSLVANALPDALVVGIDSEPRGIEIAKKKVEQQGQKNVSFKCNKSDILPFADTSFDLVVMTDVIEHLVSPSDMMKEILRVLAPSGSAIITTPNRQDGAKWDDRHEHEFDGPELKALMLDHFAEVEIFGSWPMSVFRSGKTVLGRLLLNIQTRAGFDALGREMKDPTSDYGQLLAVCRYPNKIVQQTVYAGMSIKGGF